MKLDEKVWYTGDHTKLHNQGFKDNECTFLLHTYGTVIDTDGDMVQVSFEEFTVPEYDIVQVWINKCDLKVDNTIEV